MLRFMVAEQGNFDGKKRRGLWCAFPSTIIHKSHDCLNVSSPAFCHARHHFQSQFQWTIFKQIVLAYSRYNNVKISTPSTLILQSVTENKSSRKINQLTVAFIIFYPPLNLVNVSALYLPMCIYIINYFLICIITWRVWENLVTRFFNLKSIVVVLA